jgi:hypothetical protein
MSQVGDLGPAQDAPGVCPRVVQPVAKLDIFAVEVCQGEVQSGDGHG